MGLDRAVLDLIADHRAGWATTLTLTVADFGTSSVAYLAALALCVVFGWALRAWRPAVAAPVAAIVAINATELAKGVIGRPRPPHELAALTASGSAMPSSIAAMTSAAALPVILASVCIANGVGRVLIAVVATATVGTGACMVYLGAHWLTDVLVGWALGGAIGVAVFRVIAGPIRPRMSPSSSP